MLFSALALLVQQAQVQASGDNLIQNPGFETPDATGTMPKGFEVGGSGVHYQITGYADEFATAGIGFDSSEVGSKGSVSQIVPIDPKHGKWVTFRFRGKAEDGFTVDKDALYMKFDFLSDGGKRYEDSAKRLIYREVLRDRKDFGVNGAGHKQGGAVWRTYEFEELLPFAETDSVRVTVAFENGHGTARGYSRFLIDDFEVTQSTASTTGRIDPAIRLKAASTAAPDPANLVALGGRWYYSPAPGETVKVPLTVTYANAERLFYHDDRWRNPFAGNMTGWLRKGYLDYSGQVVKQDKFLKDNVVITFKNDGYITVRSKNLPNHPTAKFPDTYGTQGYNPGYIQEHDTVYRLPLVPQKNPRAMAMTPNDGNMALPMGTVGIAVNGVAFFNPFDGGMQDASNQMDRCCGHPNPQENLYHYHKYPVCVNTPFVDKGEGHSPVLGFAFDGFPVYGPYERAGTMAKDDKENPLDAFNAHYDAVHGWHYHVTPGQFPYILGGYMGVVERSNLSRPPRR